MKPNVLQLVDSFHQGGTELQAVQLIRLLHESGHYRVHVACLNRAGVLRAVVDRLGLKDITEFPLTSFYDRNMATQLRRFGHFLREREIDVLHTHDFYTNVFGMAGAVIARRPLVRVASRRETSGMRSRAQKFIQRFAYAHADAIVANAEAVRRELISEGVSAAKVATIYNGVDVQRLTPPEHLTRGEMLARLNLGEAGSRRLITIVANMRHPVKDHKTFLRAARKVRDEVADAAFVLAGEGELTEPLRALAAELGLERDSFFIGPCALVAELLAVSEVCVLSSTNEGFANSILEYMAAGRPVVVTDVGGAREAVIDGETGYIVPPGDAETMAARITAFLKDPALALRAGVHGRRVIEQKFSCQTQLTRTIELYERLLAKAEAGSVSPHNVAPDGRQETVGER